MARSTVPLKQWFIHLSINVFDGVLITDGEGFNVGLVIAKALEFGVDNVKVGNFDIQVKTGGRVFT